MTRTLVLLLAVLTGGVSLAQETAYVTDRVSVTLRTGQSTKHEILRMVTSDSRLTVLERNPETGYSRVRLPDGTEGWILSRYVTTEPTARLKLQSARQELESLRSRATHLEEELNELRDAKQAADRELARLKERNASLAQELAEIRRVSSDAVNISERNRTLNKRLTEMETQMQMLRQQNATLNDRSNRDWFVVGAVVVVGSMLLGIALTRIRWRRRSEWSEL